MGTPSSGYQAWRQTPPSPALLGSARTAAHLGGCPGSQALLAWRKLTMGRCRWFPPRPLRSPGRALALDDRGPWTRTHPSLLPHAPARPLCPGGHHSRLGPQAGLREPEVSAGALAWRPRTRTGPQPPRCFGARTSAAPDHPGD